MSERLRSRDASRIARSGASLSFLEGAKVREGMMHVRLDELRGKNVFDANGRAVGRVHAALVDMETWLVDTMRIAIARHASGDLDVPWSFWQSLWRPRTIDVATGQIQAAG